jgi:hypothetical protein
MKRTRSTVFKRTIGTTLILGLFIFGISSIIWLNQDGTHSSSNPFINISELPNSFMEKYLSDYSEVSNTEDKQNTLIVTSLKPLENTYGAKNVISAANNQYFLVFNSDEEKNLALEQISGLPDLTVSKNVLHTYLEDGNDDQSSDYNSWGIEKMGLDHAKELVDSYPGKSDVIVAILDTGLDVNLFKENYSEDKLLGTYNVQSNSAKVKDEVGHGTHIAGTIAEGTPDNVKIFSIKMSNTREIFSTDIIAAIDYATYYLKPDVMNMSFGGYIYEESEYLAIEAAKENNIISVAAAGNESTGERSYPSSFDNTISISAVDSDLRFAEFSNYGPMVDFTAPGVDILSINGDMSGTSMATPHAVAAVAIARSFNKEFTMSEAIDFLKTRATDLGAKGKDGRFGWGFIDFNNAVLCTNSSDECDEFSIFEKDAVAGIEILDPVLTQYNYGSLTNILATKIKINNKSGGFKEIPLGDLGKDVEITGYNPFATGDQQVTVKYEDSTANFTVKNPDNWESGWLYTAKDSGTILEEYRDHNLQIKTLYLPEEIDGHPVTEARTSVCLFHGTPEDWPDYFEPCVYPDSEDSRYYETVIVPASYKRIGGFHSNIDSDMFQSLYQVISLGDELEVGGSAFSFVKSLASVEGKIKLDESSRSAFWFNTSLEKITLADDTEIIPESVFANCESLESINLPDSVTAINNYAFDESGIRSINLGEHVTTIGERAFARSALENIYISSSVTTIGKDVFAETNNLRSVIVDEDNPKYDSRDNSNAVILTSEDKLIIGTKNTVIPSTVKIIGENAFASNQSIYEITIPEGVETIEQYAFNDAFDLQKVVMPRSVTAIDETAFTQAGAATPSKAVFWVWNNSYAHNFALEQKAPYVLRDEIDEENTPMLIANATFEIVPEGRVLYARDQFSPDNFHINIFYYDEEADVVLEEPEVIEDFTVIYNGGSSDALVGGYNEVSFIFNTASGYQDIKIDLYLTAKYLTPEYEIPTGVTAYSGQALSEVELPEGFSWMNGNEFVDESKTEYLGKFTPEDNVNYMEILDIPIPVTVKVGTTFAEIFPDEALRLCIVENINNKNSTDYTPDTIDIDTVLSITELNCDGDEIDPKITNTRGIERLVNLETLALPNNSISVINLAKNQNLESLNLRGNLIPELDVSKNQKLSELLIDGTKIGGEMPLITTSTFISADYPNDSIEPDIIMDISNLNFLKDKDFTIVGVDANYDDENHIIHFAEGGMEQIIVTVRMDNGETISYAIYGFPRNFYFTAFLDGKKYDDEMKLFYTYTGVKLNMKAVGEDVMNMLGINGYELENITIKDLYEDYVVGEKDAHVSLYFKAKTDSDSDPTDPDPTTDPIDPGTEPGSGTDPGDPQDLPDNPQTGDNIYLYFIAITGALAIFMLIKIGLGRKLARIRR